MGMEEPALQVPYPDENLALRFWRYAPTPRRNAVYCKLVAPQSLP